MIFNLNFLKFNDIPVKSCTREDLMAFIVDERTKRIHFNSEYHEDALKRIDGNDVGRIKLPFKDTINPILKSETGCILFDSQYDDKCYRTIKSEEEYENIEQFVNKYKEIVYLT